MSHNKKSIVSFTLAAIGLAATMSLVGFASEDLIYGPQLQLAAHSDAQITLAYGAAEKPAATGIHPA